MKTEKQMAAAAAEFVERWRDKGYEKGQSQIFWADLLSSVYGVEHVSEFLRYEEQVTSMVDSTNFIDVHIPSTKVLIEQKSIDVDLRKPVKRGESYITPFLQAKLYIVNMPQQEHPKWVVTCNFRSFLVYDMNQPHSEPEEILLQDLGREYYRLKFLVDAQSEHIRKEMRVSMQAGEIVGRIYEALLRQYDDTSPQALRWLNILCVRLVFCLYAEDAGIFLHDQFHDYLRRYDADDLGNALIRLFEVLRTPQDKRSKYLKDDLKAFPYTNGGLFEEDIEIPPFTDELKQTLLENASQDFDWSEISPTIFGAVFESTLNPETRRSGGMHYTSIENIHKVIDPLFLNDLRSELDDILEEKVEHQRQKKLDAYQDKLASLTFLDPACGSGNFLTETYLSLRRLENEVIRHRTHGQTQLAWDGLSPAKVSIQQFYGIEINDFAVTVATTALWISEAQMLRETERIIHHDIDFLPLKSYHNIREGNALRMDWDTIEIPSDIPTIHAKNTYVIFDEKPQLASEPDYNEVNLVTSHMESGPKPLTRKSVKYDYIIGNPPFVGYSLQSKEQKDDILSVFVDETGKPIKSAGKIDYVAGWYYKAAQLMKHSPSTRAALVSTNSITQGEQVAAIWKPLKELFGIHIDFAHRTFRWDSEATLKAHVHCVIVGFSVADVTNSPSRLRGELVTLDLLIFEGERAIKANHINAYLIDADDIFIEARTKPICDVPQMLNGGKPTEGGFLILTADEKDELLQANPQALNMIRPYMMGKDFIERKPRFCLWLVSVSPSELRQCPKVMERIAKVRDYRLASPKAATQKKAETPMLFDEVRECASDYVAIPKVSSKTRRYIPMEFLPKEIIPGDKLFMLPAASLYSLGIMTSNVHMAWMRAVCGRLKSDYSYSNTIVYNNFPWPTPTEAQKAKIEQTAQAILDARALYPDSSLADLYDELTMPVELRRAHQQNDRAVMEAYGFPVKSSFTESQCVAELFKMYQELTK